MRARVAPGRCWFAGASGSDGLGRGTWIPFISELFRSSSAFASTRVFMASSPITTGTSILQNKVQRDRLGRQYTPAVGPRLKILLAVLFASVALLGASGLYLLAIGLLERLQAQTYTNQFTLAMQLAHIVIGFLALAPFLFFGILHWVTARQRPNKVAVRLGILLFIFGLIACVTGIVLVQLFERLQLQTGSVARLIVYWLHLLTPVAAIVLYVQHRRAGPRMQWRWGAAWGVGVTGFVAAMVVLHSHNPYHWNTVGPKEGVQYFFPSEARTGKGLFLSAQTLMMDEYCMKCHQEIYKDHLHSAHKVSSFNNPPYLFSVRETRKVSLERDGDVKAARWCAGCHDPVPFLSGAFDNPKFDDVKDPTAHAGITCTVCHAMTHIDSTMGNAAYTIEEPPHYPFATSENAALQWVNNQMIKARPDFHKKTFLKPLHKTAEFCSTCHKVSLPPALNYYKEFLRGQNHYDTYLLSGVSGHGVRSFYYPPQAKTNCAECHMPLRPSNDFAAKDFDGTGVRKSHNHFFPGGNTGLPYLMTLESRYEHQKDGFEKAVQTSSDFLRGTDPEGKDRKVRIDLFGIKEGGSIDGKLTVLRPQLPKLKPGQSYLVEVVVRTLNIGHPFTQGTVDSNEIWVDFQARAGERELAHSGALKNPDDTGPVDEWSHFINVLVLDRNGNRINRRNPQDIFTPLYDHQIPPGAGQVVHYRLDVPADVAAPIELKVRLRYRKFDHEYLALVYKDKPAPKLPIVDLCEDRVLLPVEGAAAEVKEQSSPIKPAWQRWNDYGIGCLIEGGAGLKKGELKQAESAFKQMLTLEQKDALPHAYLNLARVYIDEGRLTEAAQMLNKASPLTDWWWSVAWFNGLVNAETAASKEDFDRAIRDFEQIVDPKNRDPGRKFDFTQDYVVLDKLAQTLFKRALLEGDNPQEQRRFLEASVARYDQTLALDGEDLDAHYGLNQAYQRLGRSIQLPAVTINKATPEEVQQLADRLADGKASSAARLETAAQLGRMLTEYGKEPTQPKSPKLPILKGLLPALKTAYQSATEPEARAALALVLGQLHLELHAIYRPDDSARARTTAIYRKNNPAANHAAEAIVIYPTTEAQREAIRKQQNAE
jgi:Tetratricopeptide repeat/Cytochrome c554 and c-prime